MGSAVAIACFFCRVISIADFEQASAMPLPIEWMDKLDQVGFAGSEIGHCDL